MGAIAFLSHNLISLPCSIVGVPIVGFVYVQTGSYYAAVVGVAALALLGLLGALQLARRSIAGFSAETEPRRS